jgi:hypothetical protein
MDAAVSANAVATHANPTRRENRRRIMKGSSSLVIAPSEAICARYDVARQDVA